MKNWYSIKATGKTANLSIYDEIGGFGVTAQSFINELNSLTGVSNIHLHISSEGGSVQEGVAIYNALKRHQAKVDVFIDGWALSMASFIAMAGDKVYMSENALMMIHNAWGGGSGDARELRKTADILEKATDSLVDGYVLKTGKSREEISSMLDEETWMTAEEALEQGFIDHISEPVKISAQFNINKFNPPEKVKGLIMQKDSVNNSTSLDAHASSILIKDAERRQSIRAVFSKFKDYDGVDQLMDALENDINCSVQLANDKLLAHLGSQSFPISGGYYNPSEGLHVSDKLREFKAAATDALLIRSGLRLNDPSPMVRDVQRMDVVMMAERILSMQGRSVNGMSRVEIIKAAHSSSDFPLLLANTAGKALRIGYESEPSTHVLWTAEKEVPDFKTQSMVALSEAPNLLEVPESSEYKNGSFGESAEEFAIKTYGRIFGITRQALINDDLGALTSMPAAFGAAARRLEADLVYGKLLSSSAMSDGKSLFHADHGNLAAAGTALSIASLAFARAAMRRQKGVNGLQHIDPVPRFLIVPVSLETTAEQLVSSLVDPSKSNDATNVQWVRNLTVVADPRLDENSEFSWYLSANPSQIEGIVRAYLTGQDRPYYEVDEEFNRDVTSIKSRLDIAVGTIDFRALYKNPGAAL
ncbi:ClpP-like prohead protease/major capsid protein fusion protein [Methylotenera sp. L2L1]|uniref:ClpP-like prohead protease/major capsid protein fusion protein n=1 Tax=Methylotenera sp. L2L1 TaxID=1502770 RepID=UPI00068CC051|nr:ClpP-like prohead protease/major capsid protein fusion protein [Methylotenera sp. L2L1]